MRARDLRRLCTFYRTAVEAVLYAKLPGPDQALADLRASLDGLRMAGDWRVDGAEIPTSFVASVLGSVRLWLDESNASRREALTSWATSNVDTLAKWLDGKLFANAAPESYWQKIGG